MKILVFIKQVADTEARIIINDAHNALEIENKYNINFFDEFAVEEALKIKEKFKESQVNICTYGGKKAIEALRTAIAMGADQAFLIDNTDKENFDSGRIAKILSAFARTEGYDLILCGRQAIDDENANIGAMIAEFLGIPHVSAILGLEVADEKKIRVESEIEGGKATIEVQLPALVTTQKGLNTPRVPLITGVMKAMKATIPTIETANLGLPEGTDESPGVTIVRYEPPKERPPVKMMEGETPEEKVKNLVKALKDEAKAL